MKELLICTDLDRTLLPNGPQSESSQARKYFHSLVSREEVTLVYVTGRHKALVQEAIKFFSVPNPDFVIADVGSTIYKIDGNKWSHWQDWELEIAGEWQGKSHDDLRNELKEFKDLRLQERSKQNKHKLSYYVPLYVDHESLFVEIENKLNSLDIKANLIWSIDEEVNIGLIDILPANANKLHAINFLMRKLDFDINHTIFSGDSGNDISVIASPIHSILVANASNDVKEQAIQEAKDNEEVASLYIAQGGYLGMNGNYSAGIIEGIVHYIPSIDTWIK